MKDIDIKRVIYMAAKKTKTKKQNRNMPQKKKAVMNSDDKSFVTSPVFIHGVIWIMMLVFTVLFMYIDKNSTMARAAHSFFGGILGITAYLFPIVIMGTLAYFIYAKSVKKLWIKFALCIAELIDFAAMIGVFAEYSYRSAYTLCGYPPINGGGLFGVFIAERCKGFMGGIGSMLLFIVLFIVLACFISSFNIIPYIRMLAKQVSGVSDDLGNKVTDMNKERDSWIREQINSDSRYDSEQNYSTNGKKKLEHIKSDDSSLPKSLKERRAERESHASERRSDVETINIANEYASDLINNSDRQPNVFDDPLTEDELYNMRFNLPEAEPQEEMKPTQEDPEEELFKTIQFKTDENDAEELDENTPPKEKKLTEDEKTAYSDELERVMAAEQLQYEFPTFDLLDKPKAVSADKRQELYRKAEQLISVLDNFGVKAKPVQVTQGPTVTRYEIQPSSGTKLSKIVGLADDIALNLAVTTVLIAPVPGKAGTVGVEIPNSNVTAVSIRELLESPEFQNAKSKLTVCLGKDIGGNVVVGDIAKWPHALIAGATGSGKSVCINTIITSILFKADPNDVKLIMVDPKQVELGIYNGIPHLLIPVVTEAKKAAGALNWAVQEMMRRYDLFKNTGVRKLEMYNKLMEKTGGEKIPQLVIIIDELADLMMVAAKEVEDYICRLAQLARAAGIHLIIATQRPSVDVITGLIKANVPSRIAFFVSSQVDSRTILDKAGAEKLLGMGDMLYFPAGARSTARVQGAFVSDGEVERIVDFIKGTSPKTHYREDLADHIERIEMGENGVTPDKEEDGDPLLNEAIQLAIELGKISTSMVQRRLSVGYSRAGRIIDQMEARGIISAANGSKPRDVLVSHADFAGVALDDEDN